MLTDQSATYTIKAQKSVPCRFSPWSPAHQLRQRSPCYLAQNDLNWMHVKWGLKLWNWLAVYMNCIILHPRICQFQLDTSWYNQFLSSSPIIPVWNYNVDRLTGFPGNRLWEEATWNLLKMCGWANQKQVILEASSHLGQFPIRG